MVELYAEAGIAVAANPKVAKEGVVYAGHAAEEGAASDEELAEIAEGGSEEDEKSKAHRTEFALQPSSKVIKPIHIKKDVQEAEVDEDGGDDAPKLAGADGLVTRADEDLLAGDLGQEGRASFGAYFLAGGAVGDFDLLDGAVVGDEQIARAGFMQAEQKAEGAHADHEKGEHGQSGVGLPENLRAHVDLAVGGAFILQRFLGAHLRGFGGGFVVTIIGSLGLKLFQLVFGLLEEIVIMDPNGPRAVILLHVIGDAVGVQIITKSDGFGFVGDFSNGAHATRAG